MTLYFATNEFFLIFWLLTVGTLVLSREIARRLLHFVRIRGRNLRNVIIIGEGSRISPLAQQLTKDAGLGYQVLRVIDVKEMQEDGRAVSNR